MGLQERAQAAAALLAAGLGLGYTYSMFHAYGLFYKAFLAEFDVSRTTLSWIGGLNNSMLYLPGSLSALLVRRLGLRVSFSLGCCLVGLGCLLTASLRTIWAAYLGYGLMAGYGGSLLNISTFLVIPVYFPNHVTRAASLVTLGPSVLLLILPYFLSWLEKRGDWSLAVSVYGACALHIIPCSLLLTKSMDIYSQRKQEKTEVGTGKNYIYKVTKEELRHMNEAENSAATAQESSSADQSHLADTNRPSDESSAPDTSSSGSASSGCCSPTALRRRMSAAASPSMAALLWQSFCWAFADSSYFHHFPEHVDRGYNPATDGVQPSVLVFIVYSVSCIFSTVACLWCDRLGNSQIYLFGLAGTFMSAAILGFGLASNLAVQAVFSAVIALCIVSQTALMTKTCSLVVDVSLLPFTLSMFFIAMGIGALLSPVVSGVLLDRYGERFVISNSVLSGICLTSGLYFIAKGLLEVRSRRYRRNRR